MWLKRKFADAIGKRVLHILYEELDKKMQFRKLVPHSLAIQEKLNRKQVFSVIWSILRKINTICWGLL